jgi:hypothetical protein
MLGFKALISPKKNETTKATIASKIPQVRQVFVAMRGRIAGRNELGFFDVLTELIVESSWAANIG